MHSKENRRDVPFAINPILRDFRLVDDASSIQSLVANETPVYEETWPVSVLNQFSNENITCSLPAPGVVANVVMVGLIGKNVEQTPGWGYYACIDTLDCKGIPLNTDAPGVLRS